MICKIFVLKVVLTFLNFIFLCINISIIVYYVVLSLSYN